MRMDLASQEKKATTMRMDLIVPQLQLVRVWACEQSVVSRNPHVAKKKKKRKNSDNQRAHDPNNSTFSCATESLRVFLFLSFFYFLKKKMISTWYLPRRLFPLQQLLIGRGMNLFLPFMESFCWASFLNCGNIYKAITPPGDIFN